MADKDNQVEERFVSDEEDNMKQKTKTSRTKRSTETLAAIRVARKRLELQHAKRLAKLETTGSLEESLVDNDERIAADLQEIKESQMNILRHLKVLTRQKNKKTKRSETEDADDSTTAPPPAKRRKT